MFIRSLLGAALLALSSVTMADTVTPSQVGNLGNNSNLASDGFLTVNWSDATPNIGLIQFDLSAYAGDNVSSATLNLFQRWNSAPGAVFGLYANTSAWTSAISGNVSDGPSFAATPVAQFTIGDWNQGVWRSADVTAIVNDWTHGVLPNYGLTLERIDSTNPLVYFSSGLANTDAPTLSLTASVPEPENIALLLAGVACLAAVARRRGTRA